MTPDVHLKDGKIDDFPPGSQEANIRRRAHAWRLLSGAEPAVSRVLFSGLPTHVLRYHPYLQSHE